MMNADWLISAHRAFLSGLMEEIGWWSWWPRQSDKGIELEFGVVRILVGVPWWSWGVILGPKWHSTG